VKDLFVIRMKSPLTDEQINELNRDFSILVLKGKIEQGEALSGEDEFLDLPRLTFHFTRSHYGILRQFYDRLNSY